MSKLPSVKLEQITLEHLLLGLIVVGLPLIAHIWFGWRATITTLILTLITLGIIKLRYS